VARSSAFVMDMERGEEHQRQFREEQRSGKGDQPALFAVAQAIVRNDQDAIRAAAKALANLQAPDVTARRCLTLP
jgi:hypothetical protein